MWLSLLWAITIYGFLYTELNVISFSTFKISSPKLKEIPRPIRIIQLSDLHAKQFGSQNKRLIRKIKQLKPDIIIATGDMITSTDDNGDAFLNIAVALAHRIPIYYIEGNHELTAKYDTLNQMTGWYDAYLEDLNQLGVHILKNNSVDLNIFENQISLHGLIVPLAHYYAVPQHIRNQEDVAPLSDLDDVLSRPNPSSFNVLLAHNPFLMSLYEKYPVDLVCSGHVHGGAIRLPFIGGILSPERKLFPKYSAGLYKGKHQSLIVSRGLGRFRLFNRPEIVIIDLLGRK